MSSNNDSNEKDIATNQVLEYYKKYSQNRDLPKYFSGSSVSYLPEIENLDVPKQNTTKAEVVVTTNIDVRTTSPTDSEKSEVENNGSSRASSEMSNKRLEWDNGADIGYGNCHKQKPNHLKICRSSSLSALSELKYTPVDINPKNIGSKASKPDSRGERNVEVLVVTYSASSSDDNGVAEKINVIELPSSSSGTVPEESEKIVSSSSNSDVAIKSSISSSVDSCQKLESGEFIDDKISNFAVTLLQLKQKIGLPNAQSTPNYFEFLPVISKKLVDTPFLKKSEKVPRNILEKSIKHKRSKSDDESLTKVSHIELQPNLYVSRSDESISKTSTSPKSFSTKSSTSKKKSPLRPHSVQKIVNLCLTKPITVECNCSPIVTKSSTVAVQTEVIPESEAIQIVKSKLRSQETKQTVVYFEHDDRNSKSNTCSSQTDSNVLASRCDSFEYQKISNGKNKSFNQSEKMADSRGSEPDNKGLAAEPSTENIEKAAQLIQRLIQSKKYNAATKKKYIKNIIEKMSESKYFEESSTSSDLFFPKKIKVDFQKSCRVTTSDSSRENVDQQNCQKTNFSTHSKIVNSSSPRKRKLEIKTFTDAIPTTSTRTPKDEDTSPPEVIPVQAKIKSKIGTYFTLTNNEFSVNHMAESSVSDGIALSKSDSHGTTSASLKKNFNSSSTSGASAQYDNWREDKTSSEKKLESKCLPKNKKDHLVKFAEQERKQQITWINSEITHLSKLRNLLEKQDQTSAQQSVGKRTTVYKVLCSDDSRTAKSSSTGGSARNYIIETELRERPSGNIEYHLGGRKYAVEEGGLSKKSSLKRRVAGDIKVVTNDNVTNIKICTFCQICKQTPCVCLCLKCLKTLPCGCDKLQVCCPVCNKSESECMCTKGLVQSSSATTSCTCGKSSSENVCEKCVRPSSDKIICSNCFKTQCICKNIPEHRWTVPKLANKNVGDALPHTHPKRLCPLCQEILCGCSQKPSTSSAKTQTVRDNRNADQQVDSNSLKRVFENCDCTTQTDCKCPFVEKLVRHFKQNTEIIQGNKVAQTKNFQYENIGVQVQVPTEHGSSQTLKPSEKILSAAHHQSEIVDVEPRSFVSKAVSTEQLKNSLRTFGDQARTKSTQSSLKGTNVGILVQRDTKNQEVQASVEPSSKVRDVTVATVPKETVVVQGNKSMNTRLDTEPIFTQTYTGVKNFEVQTRQDEVPEQTQTLINSERKNSKICVCDCRPVTVDRETTFSSSNASSGRSVGFKPETKQGGNTVEVQVVGGDGGVPESGLKEKSSEEGGDGERLRSKKRDDHRHKYGNCEKACTCCCNMLHNKKPCCTAPRDAFGYCDPSASSNGTNVSTSLLNSEETPYFTCACCKKTGTRENVQLTRYGEETFPLCTDCYRSKPVTTGVTVTSYSTPEHVCTCYSYNKFGGTAQHMRAQNIQYYDKQYCTCVKPYQHQKNYEYCGHCLNRLRKTAKSKGGIAYSLKVENVTPHKFKKKKKKERNLQEICINVPSKSRRRKVDKDKENYNKKVSEDCIECENLKKQKEEHYRHKEETSKNSGNGNVQVELNVEVTSDEHSVENTYSLQEYLRKNRPDFVDSAENRRKAVMISRLQREGDKDEMRLRFLVENSKTPFYDSDRNPRLFSEKEMKEITKKNYKKLPEVQEKLMNQRLQRLRSADKMIKNVLVKKIQTSVLKGKRSFPIDKNVVSLPAA